jgi:2-methylisocitrate lyase-like PEP mutase family enzyme
VSKVKKILAEQGTLVMPGVYDPLSAKIAERAGFSVMFTTGYGISATLLGEPDFGLLTQTEMLSTAYRICGAVHTPILVDSDTGYGNAMNVARTVKELLRAGARGMFLEDQVWPKRCGHMAGKQVIPLDEYLKKLGAAIDARGDGDLFITARTDSRQVLGLEEAIRRGVAFKENGADAVFVEAPETAEEMREIARNVPGPLVANMVERGVTPLMSRAELEELGFALVLWPVGPLFAAANALKNYYGDLQRNGAAKDSIDRVMSFDEFTEIVGLDAWSAFDAKYGS